MLRLKVVSFSLEEKAPYFNELFLRNGGFGAICVLTGHPNIDVKIAALNLILTSQLYKK